MDGNEALQHLRKAKTAHLKWRTYAQALAAGVGVEDGKAPVAHTECEFGLWYMGPGQALRKISHLYEDIEDPHRLLHEAYADIYQFAKAGKFAKASEKLATLEAISRSLMDIVDACMDEIRQR